MKPLVVLLTVFVLSLVITFFTGGMPGYIWSGNIAMCVMLCFTGIAHFAFTKGMMRMLPGMLPFKKAIVLLTGVFEMIAGIALLFTSLRAIAGWALVMFLLLVVPANILAAIKRISYQKEGMEGNGTRYLWFRIPLQLFFIAWIAFFSIRPC